jgi:hypothetical protein
MTFPLEALQIVNIAAFALYVVIHIVGLVVPIGEANYVLTRRAYWNWFTTADFVPGMWAILAALLGAFTIWQALPRNRHDKLITAGVWYFFMISCLLVFGWIFAFQYQIMALAFSFMGLLVIAQALIYFRIYRARPGQHHRYNRLRYWLVKVPFSVFFAWSAFMFVSDLHNLGAQESWNMSRSMISTIVFTVFLAAGSLTLMMIYSDPWVPITMGYCIIGIYADKISMMHGSIALTSLVLSIILLGVGGLYLAMLVALYGYKILHKKMKRTARQQDDMDVQLDESKDKEKRKDVMGPSQYHMEA